MAGRARAADFATNAWRLTRTASVSAWRRSSHAYRRVGSWAATQTVLREARVALPFFLLYGLALGGTLALGAELSTARPSRDRPFGWPGPASFDNGVAMVRNDLALCAAIPPLLLGLTLVRRLQRDLRSGLFVSAVLTDLAAVALGALLAGLVGVWGSARASPDAYWAFVTAHGLLGLSFFALGLLPTVVAPIVGLLAGGFLGLAYLTLYDNWVKWRIFRELGYNGIMSGAFPTWFYLAQVFSPLSTYRGMLITWRPQFRDWEEQAALREVVLPSWVNPVLFGSVHLFVWVAIPIEAAIIVWVVRSRRRASITRTGPQVDPVGPGREPSFHA